MSEMTPNEVKLASRLAENSTRLRYLREEHPDQVDEIRSQPVEEIIEEILQPNVQVAFPAKEILAVEEVEIGGMQWLTQ